MKTIAYKLVAVLFITLLMSCSNKKSENSANQADSESTNVNYYEDIQGAWTTEDRNTLGEKITITTIVMDGFIAESFYNLERKEFFRTFGGSWSVDKNVFTIKTEFSSLDSSQVGTLRDVIFDLQGDTIRFKDDPKIWTRIDNGKNGNLSGAWLITGRERDGEMSRREPGPRKTMKILSDTRFQWIAYNTETKEFFGTGGGTYTAENKDYVENLEFFSRDSSRVGAILSFEFGIVNDEWHHKGMSSKGNPIHEVWTLRTELEK